MQMQKMDEALASYFSQYRDFLEFRNKNEHFRFGHSLTKSNKFKNKLIEFLEFLIIFFLMLLTLGHSFKSNKQPNQGVILVYGIDQSQITTDEEGLEKFRKFLIQDRFALKKVEDCRILVEIRDLRFLIPYSDKNIIIGSHMEILLLLQETSFSKKLWAICGVIFKVIQIPFRPNIYWRYRLIIRQLLIGSVYQILAYDKVQYLVTTQSQMLLQPLPFHFQRLSSEPRRLMFWYSTNHGRVSSKGIPWKFDYDSKLIDMKIDLNFVWTNAEKTRLNQFGVSAQTVGSILFVPNPTNNTEIDAIDNSFVKTKCDRKIHNIIIFDITPRNDASEFMLYSANNMEIFMREIFEAIKEVKSETRIILKPKRNTSNSAWVDQQYTQFIEDCLRNNLVSIISPSTNLYEVSNSYCCSISIPFTSAGLVVKEFKKSACHFIPESLIGYLDVDFESGMELVVGIEKLKTWLRNH